MRRSSKHSVYVNASRLEAQARLDRSILVPSVHRRTEFAWDFEFDRPAGIRPFIEIVGSAWRGYP